MAKKSLSALQDKIMQKVKTLDTIPKIQKETVCLVARHFIRTEYPEKLKEFDTSFEGIYNYLQTRQPVDRKLAATLDCKKANAYQQKTDVLSLVVAITDDIITQLVLSQKKSDKNQKLILNQICQEFIRQGKDKNIINGLNHIIYNLLIK